MEGKETSALDVLVESFEAITPLPDLEDRLRLLKERGVREYHDGRLHIVFDREQRLLREVPVRGVQPDVITGEG